MKKFEVPLTGINLVVYCGDDEWDRFIASSKRDGYRPYDDDSPGKFIGRNIGSNVWVRNLSDEATLVHELSHFVDYMFGYIGTQDGEFRAYVWEWLFVKVVKWFVERSIATNSI